MDMEERDVYHHPLVQEHIPECLHLFLIDLRTAIGPDIEFSVRCSGPNKYALRGKEWIAEGLINTNVDGNWYSGNSPRPTIDETVAAADTRGKAFAIAESGDVDRQAGWKKRDGNLSPEAITALAKHCSGRGVTRFGLSESTVFIWDPATRSAIRAAAWSYEPAKATGTARNRRAWSSLGCID